MSFDLHLMAFRHGNSAVANRDAARAFVETVEHRFEPEFNAYSLTMHDGAHVEMFATGLHTESKPFHGAMIALRGLSDSICDFVYHMCIASSCVAIPSMDPCCVLVPNEGMISDFPVGFTDDFPVVHVRSGRDVGIALEHGYDAWATFRDRVIRDARNSG